MEQTKVPFQNSVLGQLVLSVAAGIIVNLVNAHLKVFAYGVLIVAGIGGVLLLIGYLSTSAPKAVWVIGFALYGFLAGEFIGEGIAPLLFRADQYPLLRVPAHLSDVPLTSIGYWFVRICGFVGALVGANRGGKL